MKTRNKYRLRHFVGGVSMPTMDYRERWSGVLKRTEYSLGCSGFVTIHIDFRDGVSPLWHHVIVARKLIDPVTNSLTGIHWSMSSVFETANGYEYRRPALHHECERLRAWVAAENSPVKELIRAVEVSCD